MSTSKKTLEKKAISTSEEDKESMESLAAALVLLKQQRDRIEEEYNSMRDNLLNLMETYDEKNIVLPYATVTRTIKNKYRVPTPEEVRRELGPILASKFIKEVVSSDLRDSISPEMAARMCPPIETQRFITITQRKKPELRDSFVL